MVKAKSATRSARTKAAKNDQPPAPTGEPVMKAPSSTKKNPAVSFAKTTKGKWACAAAALVLAVGIGSAVGGTSTTTDAATHALVATAPQSSTPRAADDAVEKAAKEAAEKEAAEAKVESEAEAQSATNAEAEAKTNGNGYAQEQTQRETASVASTVTPQVSEDNGARNSGSNDIVGAAIPVPSSSGGGAAAPAPSSGGSDTTVYIAASGNGKKYHSRPVCGSMKDSISISLSDAQARNLGPCSNCH